MDGGRRIRSTVTILAASTTVLGVLVVLAWIHLGRLQATVGELRGEVSRLQDEVSGRAGEAAAPISPLLLDYHLDLPGRGEVFPAMAAVTAPEYWPVAVLRITNTANRAVAQTVAAEIPGWSRRTEHSVVLGPRETRQVRIQPDLLPRAYANEEIRRASLEVRAVGPDNGVLFAQSRAVLIHGGSEIYWGRRFANAQVTARWVTPHDPAVLRLVAEARRHVPRGRMAGYAGGPSPSAIERHVREQARGIFRALQGAGITYVASRFVMGEHVGQAQRIRLPAETLRLATANCIDVSVAFASAAENLGLQPVLIIVPGHALVGVRLQPDSERVLYLDLTVLPDGSLERAAARAQRWLKRTPAEKVLAVDVGAARALGLYPLTEKTA